MEVLLGRRSNTLERREQIVEGLRLVMARNGYEGSSVAEIAGAAGLTPGLVHYHFTSKRAVLLALIENLDRRVQARVEAFAAGTAGRARDRLRGLPRDVEPELPFRLRLRRSLFRGLLHCLLPFPFRCLPRLANALRLTAIAVRSACER